jgi:hypothetical protein
VTYTRGPQMKRALIKTTIIVAAVGVFAWLFIRSARSVRSEPYEMAGRRLEGWKLSIDRSPSPTGVLLGLQPDKETAAVLFGQVFARSGETLSGPVPAAMPLVLQNEFSAAQAGSLSAEALLAAARASGIESSRFVPRCMAQRRISDPGITRQMYFVRFDWPAFALFRRQVAEQMRAAGGTGLDPAALSPILIVAGSDAAFSRWLPLPPQDGDDCLAPIAVK